MPNLTEEETRLILGVRYRSMNVDSGELYRTEEETKAARERQERLVEMLGSSEDIEEVSDRVKHSIHMERYFTEKMLPSRRRMK